jgi:hypothetical protein
VLLPLLDVPRVAQGVEQVAGREDLDAGVGVVLVLGPDREVQLERERNGGPVVGVAAGDALLGLWRWSSYSPVVFQAMGMT